MKGHAVVLPLLFAFVPAATWSAQGQAPPPPDRAQILKVSRDTILKAKHGVFVTLGEDGQPEARVMDAFAPEDDMTIWMATNALSRKVNQIRKDPRATIVYFDPAGPDYVTLVGRAELVNDPAEKKKRWKDEWRAFYADENRGDDYLLIRFTPTRLELVSISQGIINDPKTWRPVTVQLR